VACLCLFVYVRCAAVLLRVNACLLACACRRLRRGGWLAWIELMRKVELIPWAQPVSMACQMQPPCAGLARPSHPSAASIATLHPCVFPRRPACHASSANVIASASGAVRTDCGKHAPLYPVATGHFAVSCSRALACGVSEIADAGMCGLRTKATNVADVRWGEGALEAVGSLVL